ncbi:molybdate ABC transporter substrate-binding protein [Celerinatantimonas diazotrophica]|uniref:Molybdate transport system substrate-binding protein n=1 Tax=Celerinatantimonas diazotrophica TaxID=412034 RepID=A0A4R1K2I3_9GAMM|nr:molybdate ABC transporter substrate-binding protein [Celerinatantimonas diazotrophica]TCK58047.1 molybdate transport system substrate-binding protein [Celerinatantimonas diazotrophica]CAG9297884.1 Molybdate-binding protein ModA [Celerinatantimonas diazotrophica]
MKKTLVVAALALLASMTVAHAEEVKVAVAANFYKPLQVLVKNYQQSSSDQVMLSVGSTGKLYAQIVNGAPFDIFLAADQKRPRKLVKAHVAVAGSEFTYAKGRLIFWSKQPKLIDGSERYLKEGKFNKLALANPKAAPYGAAAVATLKKLGLYNRLKDKFVFGQNIGQTYSYVSYGNVQQGFVALSQVYRNGKISTGSGWIVPNHYYPAIRQDAVLLSKSADNQAAKKFLAYLQSPKAKQIIHSFGYDVSDK